MTKIPGSGSKKGQKYKTSEIRELFRNAAGQNFERYLEEMDKLKGKAYVDAYLAMVHYVIPTVSSVKVDDNGGAASMLELIRQTAQQHREERENSKE